MTDWISIAINVILLIITLVTVIYANKTLLMEYSSQVIVSRVNKSIKIKNYYPYSWDVFIKNEGKGYVVKAFILLTIPSSSSKFNKYYFLSKPVIGLKPNESGQLRITLKEASLNNQEFFDEIKVEVLYQDALNNIYKVSPGIASDTKLNEHLESFEKLPRKLSKYWIKYWIYVRKINKAIKQGNSYPERLESEIRKRREKLEKQFKNFKFKPIDKKDTK